MLDAENKRIAENLATKVSRLKSVSHSQLRLMSYISYLLEIIFNTLH